MYVDVIRDLYIYINRRELPKMAEFCLFFGRYRVIVFSWADNGKIDRWYNRQKIVCVGDIEPVMSAVRTRVN